MTTGHDERQQGLRMLGRRVGESLWLIAAVVIWAPVLMVVVLGYGLYVVWQPSRRERAQLSLSLPVREPGHEQR